MDANHAAKSIGIGIGVGALYGLIPAAITYNSLLGSGSKLLAAMKGAATAGAVGGGMVALPTAAIALLSGKKEERIIGGQKELTELHDAVRGKRNRFSNALYSATTLGLGAGYLTASWLLGYSVAMGLKPVGALKLGGLVAGGIGAFIGVGALISGPQSMDAARDRVVKAVGEGDLKKTLSEFYQQVPAAEQGTKAAVYALFETRRAI